MSILLLPPIIAITAPRYKDYCLHYIDDSASKTHGFLQFKGTNVFSPLAKFEVVPAKTGKGQVHIKCSSNNKFLRIGTEGDIYISPEADAPVEDQIWSCTLFETHQVTEDGNSDKTLLFHVQSKQYAVVSGTTDGQGRAYLGLATYAEGFDITDLESLVILPKHVALKDLNGNYLVVKGTNLNFESTDDKGIPESWFEVSTDDRGRVRIKPYNSDERYFTIDGDDIWCYESDSGSYPLTLFWPVKLDRNTVALKSLTNNKFCGKVVETEELKAAYTSITNNSSFKLEELVLSRKIYNTEFDLKKAIVYGETPITMATKNASNNSPHENTMEFKFAYTESNSSTWKASHSWMVGTEVSGSFGIPFIGDAGVTLKGEYSGSYEWGKTVTAQTTLETTYKVTVPKETSVTVSLIATKGICDVPYSYYQKDVLYNGETVVYKKNDGLYTGVNSYIFRYEVANKDAPQPSGVKSPKLSL